MPYIVLKCTAGAINRGEEVWTKSSPGRYKCNVDAPHISRKHALICVLSMIKESIGSENKFA